jgi:hypothetical protein
MPASRSMDLEALIQRLIREEVEFVLIGGFASVLHGAPVLTRDVDVCIRFSRENLVRLVAAIGDLHPRHRITPQRLPLEITDQNWNIFKNIYLETDLGILDCLGEVAGIGGFDQAAELSEEVSLSVGRLRILTLDALIRAKEAAGREHDLKTVAYLKAIKAKRQE